MIPENAEDDLVAVDDVAGVCAVSTAPARNRASP